LDRRVERQVVEQLLAAARAGRSGVLVVRGEAGIGKTALLEHVRDTAVSSGFRVEHSVGVESETQFAFSGVHQLCAQQLDHAGALPDPQQRALGVAFGLRGGTPPDRFLVGLAVLNLLAEVAEETPLLCLVDDAQWLDQASAEVLAFVARRLVAERVALVFALRDPARATCDPSQTCPDSAARARRRRCTGAAGRRCPRTPRRAGTRPDHRRGRGNPLALLELPRGAPPARLAGGFELPDAMSVPLRVEEHFRRRSGTLPDATQQLLLVAAAEPTGDAALLWRAAAQLGVAREAAEPAEAAGLLEIDTRVRFRHPLVRSAVYRAATPPDQRLVHGALAAATDPRSHPDRRAWHGAQAVLGTDEAAAAELARSADRARARGGMAAAAAFLQRAVELSPDAAHRARRALEAAQAKYEAGAYAAAADLLAVAAGGPLDALQRARLGLLRAQDRVPPDTRQRRAGDAAGRRRDAGPPGRRAVPRDLPAGARRSDHHRRPRPRSRRARGRRSRPGRARSAGVAAGRWTCCSTGLVTVFTRGYEVGAPGLRRALEAFRGHEPAAQAVGERDSRWLWQASRAALGLFDDDLVHVLATRNVRLAREAGVHAALPVRAHLPVRHAGARRGPRPRRRPRSRRDCAHAGDRCRAVAPCSAPAGGLARSPGRGRRAARGQRP
jgi:hypothetical protein